MPTSFQQVIDEKEVKNIFRHIRIAFLQGPNIGLHASLMYFQVHLPVFQLFYFFNKYDY